jgi:hypothetical protein
MPRDAAALSVTYRVIPQCDRGYTYGAGCQSGRSLDASPVACPLSLPSTYGSTSRSSGSVRQGYRPLIHAFSSRSRCRRDAARRGHRLMQPSPVGRKRSDSPNWGNQLGIKLRCVAHRRPYVRKSALNCLRWKERQTGRSRAQSASVGSTLAVCE